MVQFKLYWSELIVSNVSVALSLARYNLYEAFFFLIKFLSFL